jgi:hypothetical protein
MEFRNEYHSTRPCNECEGINFHTYECQYVVRCSECGVRTDIKTPYHLSDCSRRNRTLHFRLRPLSEFIQHEQEE